MQCSNDYAIMILIPFRFDFDLSSSSLIDKSQLVIGISNTIYLKIQII